MAQLRPNVFLAQTYRIPDTSQCVNMAEFIFLKASATVHVSVQVPPSSASASSRKRDDNMEETLVRPIRQQIVDYVDPDQLVWFKAVKGAPGFVRFEGEFATVRGMHLAVKQLDKWTLRVSGVSHSLKVRAAAARHQFPPRRIWQQCCGDGAGKVAMLHAFYLRGVPKRWFPAGGCGGIMKRAFTHWGEVSGVDVTAGPIRSGTLNLRVRYQTHDGFQGAMNALLEARLCYWNTSEPWIAPIGVDLGDAKAVDDGQRRWPDFLPAPEFRRMPPPGVDSDPESPPSSPPPRKARSSRRRSKSADKERKRRVSDERRRKKKARRRRLEMRKKKEKEKQMEEKIEVEEAELVDSQRKLESIRLLDVLLTRVLTERRNVLAELRLAELQECTPEEIAMHEEFEDRKMQKDLKLRDKIVSTYIVHEEKQLATHKEKLLRAMKGKRQLRRDLADVDIISATDSSLTSGSSSDSDDTGSDSSRSYNSSSSSRDSSRSTKHRSRRRHRSKSRKSSRKHRSRTRSSSRSEASVKASRKEVAKDGQRSPSLVGTPPPPDPRMAYMRGRGTGRWTRGFQPRMRGRGFAPLLYDADGNDWRGGGHGGGGWRGQRGFRRPFFRGRGGGDGQVGAAPKRAGSGDERFHFKRRRRMGSQCSGGDAAEIRVRDEGSSSGSDSERREQEEGEYRSSDEAARQARGPVLSRVWNKDTGWVDKNWVDRGRGRGGPAGRAGGRWVNRRGGGNWGVNGRRGSGGSGGYKRYYDRDYEGRSRSRSMSRSSSRSFSSRSSRERSRKVSRRRARSSSFSH